MMGKYKQMQIEIDDNYVASLPDDYTTPTDSGDCDIDNEYLNRYYEEHYDELFGETIIECQHEAKIGFTRKILVTYCKHCGKILDHVKR